MTDSKTFARNGRVPRVTDTDQTRRAAAEGHLLSLRPDQLEPDLNQPRRTFPPDVIAALQRDIERNGQLQPILVRPADTPGTYVIILGELRWRAISQSSTVSTISAILHRGDVDADDLLTIQLAENTRRSAPTALDLAHLIARLTARAKAHGHTQKQLAEDLGFGQARLTKYLALAKAPEDIQTLSSQDGIQDLNLLYDLKKSYDADQKGTLALIKKWRKAPDQVPLRRRLDALTQPAPPGTTRSATPASPVPQDPATPPNHASAAQDTTDPSTPTGVDLRPYDDDYVLLTIHLHRDSRSFRLPREHITELLTLLKGIQ